MNWILDHLQILVAAAAAIAFWLNQRRETRKQAGGEPVPEDASTAPGGRPVLSPEDLRRRILEQLGIPTDEPPPPEPVMAPPLPPPLPDIQAPPVIVRRTVPPPPKPVVVDPRARLRSALGSRTSVREAIVLREVLGPPVGLR
jgi:hypothetical protein